jgi:hypothetical protein
LEVLYALIRFHSGLFDVIAIIAHKLREVERRFHEYFKNNVVARQEIFGSDQGQIMPCRSLLAWYQFLKSAKSLDVRFPSHLADPRCFVMDRSIAKNREGSKLETPPGSQKLKTVIFIPKATFAIQLHNRKLDVFSRSGLADQLRVLE